MGAPDHAIRLARKLALLEAAATALAHGADDAVVDAIEALGGPELSDPLRAEAETVLGHPVARRPSDADALRMWHSARMDADLSPELMAWLETYECVRAAAERECA